jgi:hypothetical protein
MAAIFWTNVAVSIQSALAAVKTITAVTKANPGVATSTSHGYANGAYAKLTAQGMYQLNERIARVANQAANTWELEGVDTTLFGTFSSGSSELITFGTTLSSATDVTASGGDPEFADITTISDNIRKQVPIITSPFSLSFECIFDPSDAALVALKAAADNIAQRAVQIAWSSGARILFNGYVSAPLIPTGSAGEVVKTNVTITSSSRPTIYAT